MTVANSHPHDVPSTSFKVAAKMLNAAAIAMLDPLGAPPALYMNAGEQILALCEFLLEGSKGNFDAREQAYLERVRAAIRAPRTRSARKPKAKG